MRASVRHTEANWGVTLSAFLEAWARNGRAYVLARLRRLQLAGGPLLDRRVADCMSRNPKRIEAEDLAAKALAVMEAHQITSLVITDANGCPHAFIHLHDILGSKIA